MTVSSESGDVEPPVGPVRVFGMYTTDVDILIALGYEQAIRGDGYIDFPGSFPQDELDGISAFANSPGYSSSGCSPQSPTSCSKGRVTWSGGVQRGWPTWARTRFRSTGTPCRTTGSLPRHGDDLRLPERPDGVPRRGRGGPCR